jgi:hypothetical protein
MSGESSIRLTTLYTTLLACLLLVPFCVASDHWNYEETHSEVRDFISGGTVHVRLGVGDLRITRSDSTQIHLRYRVKSRSESRMKDAHVNFEVHGRDADIEFRAPISANTQFDVELEVPQNTNLNVHDKVGDLTIEEIEGDKDLELSVGDIRLAGGHSTYRTVLANTKIGDVNGADNYGEASGWLGKTLDYHGGGKYDLRAHVRVGDITLEGK